MVCIVSSIIASQYSTSLSSPVSMLLVVGDRRECGRARLAVDCFFSYSYLILEDVAAGAEGMKC